MKKTTPLNADKNNGKGRGVVPETLTPAVAQAVLEDAVMSVAADLAALAPDPSALAGDVLFAVIEPETPEEQELLELLGVPFLGRTRALALTEIGIRTVDDLRAATSAQISGVKGIGLRNAERIKDWLSAHPPPAPEMPPTPPDVKEPPVAGSPDPALAVDNAVIFDSLGEIDALTILLRSSLADGISRRLERQFDRISTVTSELAEGPDTLVPEQLQQAVKLLKRIANTLQAAADRKRLSDKKQDALAEELREHRKALQKVIED